MTREIKKYYYKKEEIDELIKELRETSVGAMGNKTETVTGTNIKINSLVNSFSNDINVKGKTLHNLLSSKNNDLKLTFPEQIKLNNGIFTISAHGQGYTDTFFINKNLIKPSTKYTVVFDVYECSLTGEKSFNVNVDLSNRSCFSNSFAFNNNLTTGRHLKILTSKSDITSTQTEVLRTQLPTSATGGTISYSVMLLEGDWTNEEIPTYFEEIKSTGEKDNKISILSHGKNLFNTNNLEQGSSPNVVGKTWDECRVDKMTTRIRNIKLIKAKPQTSYSISCGENFSFAIKQFDSNGVGVIDSSWLNKSTHSFTTGARTKYFTFLIKKIDESNISPSEYIEIQLEEGTKVTNYEDYKEDKKNIFISFEHGLKSINNIKDEIIGNKIIQRIGKYTFTGDENWVNDIGGGKDSINCYKFAIENVKIDKETICNKFKTYKRNDLYQKEVEGIIYGTNYYGGTTCVVNILKSKLQTQDVAGFKKWLKANPVTVYYELENPIIYTLDTGSKIYLNKGVNYISTDDLINPVMDITYPSSLDNAVGNNTKAINKIEKDLNNINGYSIEKSGLDDFDIFTIVKIKRSDNTLYCKSELYNGEAPCYTKRKETYYAENGITIEKVITYTRTYNEDDLLISEVID